jgi:DNA-binding MarR family transcriptional regulator
MKIDEIVKSKLPMSISKSTILNIIYTKNCISERFNEILKPYDISEEQYNVLRILRGQKGIPCNMYTIQERMLAKTSNTTRLVDKLLLKNLVTRATCEGNRRKIEVSITQKGIDLLKLLDEPIENHEQVLSKNLDSEELEQLNFLLEKYRTITK